MWHVDAPHVYIEGNDGKSGDRSESLYEIFQLSSPLFLPLPLHTSKALLPNTLVKSQLHFLFLVYIISSDIQKSNKH